MRMTRYWMTGCMAVVMMAANQAQTRKSGDNASRKHTLSRASRYSLKTTIGRIQQAARDSGMGIFANVEGSGDEAHVEQILVLSDPSGATPIVQDAWSHSELGLPLEVRVSEMEDGTSVVTIIDAAFLEETHTLPQDVVRSVSQLPHLIEVALG